MSGTHRAKGPCSTMVLFLDYSEWPPCALREMSMRQLREKLALDNVRIPTLTLDPPTARSILLPGDANLPFWKVNGCLVMSFRSHHTHAREIRRELMGMTRTEVRRTLAPLGQYGVFPAPGKTKRAWILGFIKNWHRIEKAVDQFDGRIRVRALPEQSDFRIPDVFGYFFNMLSYHAWHAAFTEMRAFWLCLAVYYPIEPSPCRCWKTLGAILTVAQLLLFGVPIGDHPYQRPVSPVSYTRPNRGPILGREVLLLEP